MPRPPRIYLEKALYYVSARGDFNQQIFKDESDYNAFIGLLKKYKEQYKFKLFAYSLLTDHFHLLLELPVQKEQNDNTGILSSVMHDLNSSYTKYFNGKYARKGHLFRERYKSALIEKEPYLLKVSAYIHLNPQKLNLSPTPQQYPYSSYILYLEKELPVNSFMKGEKEEILALLNGRAYQEFMDEAVKGPGFSNLHGFLQRGILGSKDFENRVKQALAACKKEKVSKGINFGRKLGIISFALILAGSGMVYLLRFTLEKKDEKVKPTVPLSLSYKLPDEIKDLLRDLENMEWQVRVVSPAGGKVENDIVYFEDGRFISRNYYSRNYLPSDYSLIIEDENKITWEATQPGPDAVISWRGEIQKGEMEGNFCLRSSDGSVQDFSFVSISSRRRK